MGEEGLTAKILEQGTKDYYRLYLPLETQRFIFRILAIKMIFSDPRKYGFSLTDEEYYPPLVFDTIRLNCPQETPLRIIAQAANTYFKVIKDLNPEIRGYHLDAGNYTIRVPEGAGKGFQARFKRLVKKHRASRREMTYVVEQGDNLSLIAERFDVPLSALVIWNRLDVSRPIQPGDRLIVFSSELKLDENEIKMGEGLSYRNSPGLVQRSNNDDQKPKLSGKDEFGINF
jgi:hypothetical protein